MEPSQLTIEYPVEIGWIAEYGQIFQAFRGVLTRNIESCHPLSSLVDEARAEEWFRQLLFKEAVAVCRDKVGTLKGIVVYSIDIFELGQCCCLTEHMVLPVSADSAGFGRVALEILEKIAKEQNCKMICTGNALSVNQKLTENLYTRKGSFQFSHQNFIKIL
jgi:hypothetical protein